MIGTKRLRRLLKGDGLLIAPGAYDCITARTVVRAGFPAVYMTGAGTAASLGFPDYGLVTMTEMARNAERIARSVDIPVIADADTGYGNMLNAIRTVREYERCGVAGMHIEDQRFPKDNGQADKKQLIDREEYIEKIRAAVGAKSDPDFVIMGRTDARAPAGFEEAIRRANLSLQAGADVAIVEGAQTVDEVREIPRAVQGPCLLYLTAEGSAPHVTFAEAEEYGYKVAVIPGLLAVVTLAACYEALQETREAGEVPKRFSSGPIEGGFRRLGSGEWDALMSRYARAPQRAARSPSILWE